MRYAIIETKKNVPGLTNGQYITNIIAWDGNTNTFTPGGNFQVKLPEERDKTTSNLGIGYHTNIDGQLVSIELPAIGDKYDPDTGTFSRPNSDIVLWGINTTLL